MNRKTVSILLAIILVLAGTVCSFAGSIDYHGWDSQAAYPTDVVNTQLFAPVKFLMDRKIIEGYEDGLFRPERNITRTEFLKMVLIAGNNTGNVGKYPPSGFPDARGHWGKKYIDAGVSLGYIKGMGDGTFAPDANVTYAQVFAMFLRSRGITDQQMNAYGTWPQNYARYATMYGMLGDVSVRDWNAPATRGDVAKILYRNLPK